jgi:hypothetical protein
MGKVELAHGRIKRHLTHYKQVKGGITMYNPIIHQLQKLQTIRKVNSNPEIMITYGKCSKSVWRLL